MRGREHSLSGFLSSVFETTGVLYDAFFRYLVVPIFAYISEICTSCLFYGSILFREQSKNVSPYLRINVYS